MLPHKEQLYWKSFNVMPDGAISEVAYRRNMLGEWTDPDEPALAFKATYESFRERWRGRFGWDLFKELKPDDLHYWQTLHVPSSGNQKEFDDQVMALSKVLVERINEREIAKHIVLESGDKGITKLDKYLRVLKFPEVQEFITLLRNLNGLRSGPAHVKGKDYQRAVQHFDLDRKGTQRVFSDVLAKAAFLLDGLVSFAIASADYSDGTSDAD
jgi:hypothetical protein